MSQVKIQGDASGTGIFTIAAPNSNNNRTLTLPDASGTILTNSGSESAAFSSLTTTTLSVAGNNVSAANGLGFRNRIINGDMRIDQRNAGAAYNNNGALYGVDRWETYCEAKNTVTFQQNSGGVTPPTGFTNYFGCVVIAPLTPSANNYIAQKIEGLNVSDLAWGTANAQTVTLSFRVRSSLTGTFGGSVTNSAVSRSYAFSYTISAANTWETKTVTIPGDTSGTWATNNTASITLNFSLGAGGTFVGTANTWAAANLLAPSGSVNVVATNGATFYITGVQLEAGSVATPFERVDYGRQLIQCMRYFERRTYTSGQDISMAISNISNRTQVISVFAQLVEKRASPSFSSSAAGTFRLGWLGNAFTASTVAIGGTTTTTSMSFTLPSDPGTTSMYLLVAPSQTATIDMSAEL